MNSTIHTSRKLVLGSSLRVVNKFLKMASMFILVPIMVRELGDRHYGIWVLAASIMSYQGILDLGLSSAIARFLSRAAGRNDREEYNRYFTTSFYVLSAIGAAVYLGLIVVALVLKHKLQDPADSRIFCYLLFTLGFGLAYSLPMRTFLGVLYSHLRYDLNCHAFNFGTLFLFVGTLAIFYSGQGLIALGVLHTVEIFLTFQLRAWFARRVHPGLSLHPRYFDRAQLKELLRYGYFSCLGKLSDFFRDNVPEYAIAGLHSLALVTPYNIVGRINAMAKDLTNQVISVLMPVFSRQEGRNDEGAMRKLYFFATRIATYGSIFVAGMILVLGNEFLIRWQGREFFEQWRGEHLPLVLYMLILGGFLTSSMQPTYSFLYGTSRNNFYAYTNITHGLLNLVLVVALFTKYSLIGVACALLFPALLFSFIIQPVYACRVLKIDVPRFYLLHVAPNILRPAAYIFVVYLIAHTFVQPNYGHILLVSSVSGLIYIPYIYWVGFGKGQKQLIRQIIIPDRFQAVAAK